MNDTEDTLSLSDLQIQDDNIDDSEKVSKANQSSSSSSSTSLSSFDQDFLGFFSEEWSRDTSYHASPENIIFCGRVLSSKSSDAGDRNPREMNSETSPLFRSTSDSFRFMKTAASRQSSTPRSKSLPNRLPSSSSKSKWQVFMFGFGSGKFPTTMDMSDIKSRQLRRQTTVNLSEWIDDTQEKSAGRRLIGKKGWWRLVDVLGCNGGYMRDITVVV